MHQAIEREARRMWHGFERQREWSRRYQYFGTLPGRRHGADRPRWIGAAGRRLAPRGWTSPTPCTSPRAAGPRASWASIGRCGAGRDGLRMPCRS